MLKIIPQKAKSDELDSKLRLLILCFKRTILKGSLFIKIKQKHTKLFQFNVIFKVFFNLSIVEHYRRETKNKL